MLDTKSGKNKDEDQFLIDLLGYSNEMNKLEYLFLRIHCHTSGKFGLEVKFGKENCINLLCRELNKLQVYNI